MSFGSPWFAIAGFGAVGDWNKSRRFFVDVIRALAITCWGSWNLFKVKIKERRSLRGEVLRLCRAALAQADRETQDKNFENDVPNARHRGWMLTAAIPVVLAITALFTVPTAAKNAMARWLMPWNNIDRFTFARVETLPERMVVPISEPSHLIATLTDESQWNPKNGSVRVGTHRIESSQENGNFDFEIPPLKEAARINVVIGDIRETIDIDPQPRPELTKLTATVDLPKYLQRTEPVVRDIRGGAFSVVGGSQVSFEAVASRELASALFDGSPVSVSSDSIRTQPIGIDATRVMAMEWRDAIGLSPKVPLQLKIRAAEDEAPQIVCRELEQQRVIMEKDVLSFEVDASDDFGVRTIGMEWKGTPAATSEATPAVGEKVIFAGNPNAENVDAITATFSPLRETIAPQTVELRLFVEDYLPSRSRVYSSAYTVFVLSEDEHAIWLTRQLDDWFKQSLETYEQEQVLFKRNLEMRSLSAEELDRPETRRKIESQAAAENAQSRRLSALTDLGEKLVQEASRNDQFGVDHLEKLAEMTQKLQDIAENRMPSVADLLKESANAQATSANPSKPGDNPPDAPQSNASEQKPITSVTDNPGQNPKYGDAPQSKSDDDEQPKAPSISMKESSMDQSDEKDKEPDENEASKSGPGKLSLPSVNLSKPNSDQGGSCPAGQKMDEAVSAQEELLAEFQLVAEELQKLISDLEGSTFVKRLKALSRRELIMANDINDSTLVAFGEDDEHVKEATAKRTQMLSERQRAHTTTIQHIEDDLEAYANRVDEGKFKTVLQEMRDTEIVKKVNLVADRLVANESGTSIAQSELLADTFDRWAEQLVGPG
ncbi:MAG: hypothetical protein R3C03_16635 [Pirellulaceae bacterium]